MRATEFLPEARGYHNLDALKSAISNLIPKYHLMNTIRGDYNWHFVSAAQMGPYDQYYIKLPHPGKQYSHSVLSINDETPPEWANDPRKQNKQMLSMYVKNDDHPEKSEWFEYPVTPQDVRKAVKMFFYGTSEGNQLRKHKQVVKEKPIVESLDDEVRTIRKKLTNYIGTFSFLMLTTHWDQHNRLSTSLDHFIKISAYPGAGEIIVNVSNPRRRPATLRLVNPSDFELKRAAIYFAGKPNEDEQNLELMKRLLDKKTNKYLDEATAQEKLEMLDALKWQLHRFAKEINQSEFGPFEWRFSDDANTIFGEDEEGNQIEISYNDTDLYDIQVQANGDALSETVEGKEVAFNVYMMLTVLGVIL